MKNRDILDYFIFKHVLDDFFDVSFSAFFVIIFFS